MNSQQIGLFQILDQSSPPARARRSDPDTAKKAAARVQVADLEERVLRLLRAWPTGMTSHEISAALNIDLVSISPRLRPLAEKNLVIDSGARRRGDSGRSSIVWKAV